jgi:iron complex outermembrane receptor protein
MQDAYMAQNQYEYYRNKSKKIDANIYGKANVEILKGLNAYADMQYRYVNHKMTGVGDNLQVLNWNPEFNFFNPKAGLFYSLNKYNTFYASYSVANREPSRTNYEEAGINDKPTSEKLSDIEAGYLFKRSNFSIGLNLYYMNYKDQLILTGKLSEIGEPLTSNIPKSHRAGLELMLNYKIASWLTWDGNLTLSQNKIEDYTEYVDNWDDGTQVANYLGTTDIAYSPDVIVNNMFTFSYKGFQLALQSNYVGKQYLDNTSNDKCKIDPYLVNNLRLGYVLKLKGFREIDFNMAVNNLFDEKYVSNGWSYSYYSGGVRSQDLGYYPQAGINVLGGVCLKF